MPHGDLQVEWHIDLRDSKATIKLNMKTEKTPIQKSVQQGDIQADWHTGVGESKATT